MKRSAPEPTPYTVAMAVAAFLQHKAQRRVSVWYYHRLRRVLGLVTARYGRLPIASLTARRVKAFLSSLGSGSNATKTFNNQRAQIQTFLHWAERRGF